MFTGIIDDVGVIERCAETTVGRELVIRSRYADLADGESIALNGVCLTVREHAGSIFTVAAVVTTLERTAIAEWRAGDRVNLERAMRPTDRFGGHIVQGHVDEVGVVQSVTTVGNAVLVDVEVSAEMFAQLIPHGSIAVDGVSLTVNALPSENIVQLSLIEYTLRHTALASLGPGSRVHVEGDVIAKYVRRMITGYAEAM